MTSPLAAMAANPTPTRKGRDVATAIRTTITPGKVIAVSDAELIDLDRQGLVLSREGDKGWAADAETVPDTNTEAKGAKK